MSPYLFAFLLLPAGDVQAAVRTPDGSEYSANFPNTEAGTHRFLAWVSKEAKFTARSLSHSCLAAAKGGDAQIYTTPFFEFAYRGTSNTTVWSEASLQTFLPGVSESERSASAMLKPCAQQHRIG